MTYKPLSDTEHMDLPLLLREFGFLRHREAAAAEIEALRARVAEYECGIVQMLVSTGQLRAIIREQAE